MSLRSLISQIDPSVDFKKYTYSQIVEPSRKQEFLNVQYRIFVENSGLLKRVISNQMERDISSQLDRLIQENVLNQPEFILANTLEQIDIIKNLVNSCPFGVPTRLFTKIDQLPEIYDSDEKICSICIMRLISRKPGTLNNEGGYLVQPHPAQIRNGTELEDGRHIFHYKCLLENVKHSCKCPECREEIKGLDLTSLPESEKKNALNGVNFFY
jgi:hypothetical protein